MNKGRLEAFSDGVIAVIITIMVLEMKAPHGTDLRALSPVLPVFANYVLSFVFVAIYWNNHHHMFAAVRRINGRIMWANLHLLFWLSLVPFVTSWMGGNGFAKLPTALYGGVLLMAAVAYTILQVAILGDGHNVQMRSIFGRDFKGKVSLGCYVVAIPLAFVDQLISDALFVVVAIIWFIPDATF